MSKQIWRAGNMLYPVPAALVSVGRYEKAGDEKNCNMLTVAWTGTVCSSPAMTYISVRPERYSYPILKETGEFVINLTTVSLARVTDMLGVKTGAKTDKFQLSGHDMFLSEVKAVHVDESLLDEKGRLQLEKADLIAYSHGQYFALGKELGSFGYSVKKSN